MNEIQNCQETGESRAGGQAQHFSTSKTRGRQPGRALLAVTTPVQHFLEGALSPHWALSQLWNLRSFWPPRNLPRVSGRQAVQPVCQDQWRDSHPTASSACPEFSSPALFHAGAWKPATGKAELGPSPPSCHRPPSPSWEHPWEWRVLLPPPALACAPSGLSLEESK